MLAAECEFGANDDGGAVDAVGEIIGLQVAGTRWVNPNQGAEKALEAEQMQLDSTHRRPEGESGGPWGTPPCEGWRGGEGGEEIDVTFEDCETVSLCGPDRNLEEIVVYYMRCFEDPGQGYPDGARLAIDDPALPLTIDDRYLVVEGDEVPYYLVAIELHGDVGRTPSERQQNSSVASSRRTPRRTTRPRNRLAYVSVGCRSCRRSSSLSGRAQPGIRVTDSGDVGDHRAGGR